MGWAFKILNQNSAWNNELTLCEKAALSLPQANCNASLHAALSLPKANCNASLRTALSLPQANRNAPTEAPT